VLSYSPRCTETVWFKLCGRILFGVQKLSGLNCAVVFSEVYRNCPV